MAACEGVKVGFGVCVDVGNGVFVGDGVRLWVGISVSCGDRITGAAVTVVLLGEHDSKETAMRKTRIIFFISFIFARGKPTVCVTGLVGGTLTRSTGRKIFGTLKLLEKPHRTHKSGAPTQDGGPSCIPKETVQQRWMNKLYSGKAGLEAVQRIGDAPGRSPDVHCGRRSN